MYIMRILVIIAGKPHPPAQWQEQYSTLAECQSDIPLVAAQFQPAEGVVVAFDCVRNERGA